MSSDPQLVERARRGDAAAFELLVRRHGARLLAAARLILRDGDKAEDAVQQALIRAWHDLHQLREVDRFEPWLQRLLVRACHDEFRREGRQQAMIRLLPPPGADAGGQAMIADREVLEQALTRMTPDYRVVLVLHFSYDLAPVEIADRLGVAAGTIRSRLHYAIAALRAEVESMERTAARSGGIA